ncbi:glycine cleavage system protein R [Photobacterium kishitanii]|uniref:glycine cleavage system protein R n=1 Tax=Photobacterium kishitanii TaxID=318456 RepID=UPI0007F9341B|nr:ACT domain-containing protein [Photobacterium kishitanii]OBU31817.1 amino acid-binding protein [Photobacterium kishitanii]PSW50719.1 amino acid-binding protein [Photobacterium kishitanii]PSW63044.1 amino acid-binding protein [Photobacterium kishitanii]
MKQLIVTIIGKDKPGLVEQLSDTVYFNHANWVTSSLSQLGGQFAGIIQIEVATEHFISLRQALTKIEALQIHIVEDHTQAAIPYVAQQLTVTGNDRRGIVKEVTRHLTLLGINIAKLKTATRSAPNWGYPIFVAEFQLHTPPEINADMIQQQLEQLADDLTIDIETLS